MKKILLLIALAGFTATGGYAQNKSCCCGKPVAGPRKTPVVTPRIPAKNQDASCFLVKKENIGVPGCVDVNYSDKAYLGYYLQNKKTVSVHKKAKPATVAVVVTSQTDALSIPLYRRVETEMTPCYTYSKHNIVVKQCPGEFYDNEKEPLTAAPIEYINSNSYSGYYPGDAPAKQAENKPLEGKTYPGDNLSFRGSYK